jgi:hypothetical protein
MCRQVGSAMVGQRKHADELRHALDRGLGGDKVNFTDPAAAPLGTDDEAAGTTPTPEQVDLALAAKIGERRDDPTSGRRDRTIASLQIGGYGAGAWIITILAIVLVLMLLGVIAA